LRPRRGAGAQAPAGAPISSSPMTLRQRAIARFLAPAIVASAVLCQAALPARGAGGGAAAIGSTSPSSGSGGAPLLGGGLAPVASTPTHIPPPPSKHAKGSWLKSVAITEYWPAPESWFVGQMVNAPGLPGLHRIDWLYSAIGISMEGSGIGLDGRMYHIDALGDGGWVTATGASTSPSDGWSAGAPYWRSGGYWRNKKRAVTFPLSAGGWSNGRGSKYVALPDVTFAAGASLPLHYYQSIAVDPSVIPLGSRVYVPAYGNDGFGGWFVAQDTGGAINRRHIDVYRSPPSSPLDIGQSLSSQRIFVIKPKR
jgi:3D (Asp-Asp-Asp) domain-containing protein